jgi:hypothetical protein
MTYVLHGVKSDLLTPLPIVAVADGIEAEMSETRGKGGEKLGMTVARREHRDRVALLKSGNEREHEVGRIRAEGELHHRESERLLRAG